ncbi:MAG: 4-alpha-glucanotransferase [Candidatus Eisenbacteria bacterium]|uniref:4-alpha-glucanotransferase n=1 Tax=Eiseniibacteriota bacterium TaxID=2212470 RepID=A0A956LX06_UNCEI|nr:4-alpha-glucanotransferase [Candidatus Eisenbacteria bacterium]
MLLERRSGILLHPTSLPGGSWMGDLGSSAHRFVDFLARAGQQIWQMLPVSPPGRGHSPYDTISTFAGSPGLIGLDSLVRDGLLRTRELPPNDDGRTGRSPASELRADFVRAIPLKREALRLAFDRVRAGSNALRDSWEEYRERERGWLDDFALFVALSKNQPGRSWTRWDSDLRRRRPDAVESARHALTDEIAFQQFLQFLFDRQFGELRRFARERGVYLVGDVPIYPALESADVWANAHLFDLTSRGRPRTLSGVPPDLFSRIGQLWGNPTYLWKRMEEDGYRWWVERLRASLRRFDSVRLDHLIGFHHSWCVPASARTARRGRWRPGPGLAIFQAIEHALGPVPLILEDLGLVTPEVEALRDASGHPGMRVLQFAWDGSLDNPHLPHNYPAACVAYTGTHDNTTLQGWYRPTRSRRERGTARQIRTERERALRYARSDGREFHWDMIRLVFASRANTVIVPMQDLLGLGESARMNVPGTPRGNWTWRMRPTALAPDLASRLHEMTRTYGRIVARS